MPQRKPPSENKPWVGIATHPLGPVHGKIFFYHDPQKRETQVLARLVPYQWNLRKVLENYERQKEDAFNEGQKNVRATATARKLFPTEALNVAADERLGRIQWLRASAGLEPQSKVRRTELQNHTREAIETAKKIGPDEYRRVLEEISAVGFDAEALSAFSGIIRRPAPKLEPELILKATAIYLYNQTIMTPTKIEQAEAAVLAERDPDEIEWEHIKSEATNARLKDLARGKGIADIHLAQQLHVPRLPIPSTSCWSGHGIVPAPIGRKVSEKLAEIITKRIYSPKTSDHSIWKLGPPTPRPRTL